MHNIKTITVVSESVEATEQLAASIGSKLRGGECIELVSDLGGGKTTFTRGLVTGAGSKDTVASPTFTISKVYSSSSFDIHHFDFYRLSSAGLAANELHDLLDDPKIVIVVEWAGVVEEVLPKDRVTISISRVDENVRNLEIKVPSHLNYLMEKS